MMNSGLEFLQSIWSCGKENGHFVALWELTKQIRNCCEDQCLSYIYLDPNSGTSADFGLDKNTQPVPLEVSLSTARRDGFFYSVFSNSLGHRKASVFLEMRSGDCFTFKHSHRSHIEFMLTDSKVSPITSSYGRHHGVRTSQSHQHMFAEGNTF